VGEESEDGGGDDGDADVVEQMVQGSLASRLGRLWLSWTAVPVVVEFRDSAA
jgi:hypothetical protein